MLRVLAILFAAQCASASITLNCNFLIVSWDSPIGTAYTCDVDVVQAGEGRNVVGIFGNHTIGNTNASVRALRVTSSSIEFMPQDINLFFGNLEAIVFVATPIRSISKEDLRPFPRLGYFGVMQGKLSTVSGDLFMYNPEMGYSRFDRNQITNVGPGIFQHTPNMTSTFFHDNLCINHSVSHNAEEVAAIGRELAFRCPPTVEMAEEIILNGDNFKQAVSDLVEPEMTAIDGRVLQLEDELSQMRSRVEVLERIICSTQGICN